MSLKGVVVSPPQTGRVRGPSHLQRVANAPLVCHVIAGLARMGVGELAIVIDAEEREESQRAIEADCTAAVAVQYIERGPRGEPAALTAGAFVGSDRCVLQAANGVLACEQLLAGPPAEEGDLTALVYRSAPGNGSIGLAARRVARLAGIDPEGLMTELADACILGGGVLERLVAGGGFELRGVDVLTAAELLAAEGSAPGVRRVDGWLEYSGEAERLLAINHLLLDSAAAGWPLCEPPAGSRIEGPVSVHPSASVRASTIVGPAIIGPGALVADSYIGPYTSIDAGVQIEGAEIERSVILPGASIMHIGGRLVGSVVGRETKIFRDFSLPRALRLNVGDGGEVALC